MTRPTKDAFFAGHERENMARSSKIRRYRSRVHQGLYGPGPVRGRDTCGTTIAQVINRYRKGGLMGGGIVGDHGGQIQIQATLFGQGGANQTATVGGHKVDHLGGHQRCRGDKIPLVLPVFIVHHHNNAPAGNRFYSLFDGVQHFRERVCFRKNTALALPSLIWERQKNPFH